MLDYTAFDRVLEPLVAKAEEASDTMGGVPGATAQLWRLRIPRRAPVDLPRTCEEAAARWERLLDYLSRDAFAETPQPPPPPPPDVGPGTDRSDGTHSASAAP
jgi:hypothetical protein